jgi:hypothetical protein
MEWQPIETAPAEPDFQDFKEDGECPQCGAHDGLYFARCCGRQFCWDCYWRKHEKYAIKDTP